MNEDKKLMINSINTKKITYHTNGLSPLCALVCFHTLLWLGKCFPHNSHYFKEEV